MADATPAPVHEMSRELVNLLARSGDSGEAVTVARVQEELGVGHDDAMRMLDQLRERGMAMESAPGEWEQSDPGRPVPVSGGDGRVVVNVPDGGVPEEELEAGEGQLWMPPPAEAQLRLSRSVVDRLDDAVIGQMVKAALLDVPEGGLFLMEIV